MSLYNADFYQNRRSRTVSSARTVLTSVRHLFPFSSVVDLGCGTGTWLSAAGGLGATRLVGYEGDWVRREMLDNSSIELRNVDLSRPIRSDAERFDLAMCLEVAEHLPPERADGVIEELCTLSDTVLFGAAVPGQRGVGHINEQWQDYWQEKFANQGYAANDVRPRFWSDESVLPHYAQNIFVFTRGAPVLGPSGYPINMVHPGVLQQYEHPGIKLLIKLNAELPRAVFGAIARRMSRQRASQ